jgi:hypothetical protein
MQKQHSHNHNIAAVQPNIRSWNGTCWKLKNERKKREIFSSSCDTWMNITVSSFPSLGILNFNFVSSACSFASFSMDRSLPAALNAFARASGTHHDRGYARKAEGILHHLWKLHKQGVPNVKPDAFAYAG